MQETADNYGNIEINDLNLLQNFPTSSLSQALLAYEAQQILGFTKKYTPSNDNNRMKELVDQSLDSSEAWIRGNRGWRICWYGTCSKILGNVKITKTGSTQQTVSSSNNGNSTNNYFGVNLANYNSGSGGCSGSSGGNSNGLGWYGKDELEGEYVRLKRFSLRWRTLFRLCQDASANEFYSNYRGIHDYRAINNQTKSDYVLHLSAFGVTPISEGHLHQFTGTVNDPRIDVKSSSTIGTNYVSGLARAEIYHLPPEVDSLLLRNAEYANLYNPFWQVHMSEDVVQQAFSTIPGL